MLVPVRYKALAFSLLSMLLVELNATMILSCLAIVIDDINITPLGVGILVGSYPLINGFLQLVWPPLSDTYTRKWLYTICTFFLALTLLGSSFAHIPWLFVLIRSSGAIFSSVFYPVGQAILVDTWPAEKLGLITGLKYLPMIASSLFGGLLGGVFTQFIGWESVFWFLSGLSFILFVLSLFLLPETLQTRKDTKFNLLAPIIYATKLKIVFLTTAIAFSMGATFLVLLGISIGFAFIYDLSPTLIGLSMMPFGIFVAMGAVVGGKVSDSVRKKYGIAGRLAICNISFGIMCIGFIAFAWGMRTVIYVPLIASAIFAFSRGFLQPPALTTIIELTPAGYAGSVTGGVVLIQYVGTFVIVVGAPFFLLLDIDFMLYAIAIFLLMLLNLCATIINFYQIYYLAKPTEEASLLNVEVINS